jgi:uncharacterized membrane protein YgcG
MRRLLLIGSLLLALSTTAIAAGTPEPLGDVVNDYAGVLSEETVAEIAATGEALWADHQIPLVVVTITRMDKYDELPQVDFVPFTTEWVGDWELETKASMERALYLFVSVGDRTARIALGPAYTDIKELDVQMILVDHLVPELKKNAWNEGIRRTANAMDQLVRQHPPAPLPKEEPAGTADEKPSPKPAVP